MTVPEEWVIGTASNNHLHLPLALAPCRTYALRHDGNAKLHRQTTVNVWSQDETAF